jgi:hypothetical protein
MAFCYQQLLPYAIQKMIRLFTIIIFGFISLFYLAIPAWAASLILLTSSPSLFNGPVGE